MPVRSNSGAGAAKSPTGGYAARPKTTATKTKSERIKSLPLYDFEFWVSPSEAQLLGKKVVPLPVKVRLRPGLDGTTNNGDPSLAQARQAGKYGRIKVPDDFVVKAWGEERTGYVDILDGTRGPIYVSCWERPRRVGMMTVWDFDKDGWADFCERCLSLIGGEIDPVIVDGVIEPIKAQIAYYKNLAPASPLAAQRAAELEALLPPSEEPAKK